VILRTFSHASLPYANDGSHSVYPASTRTDHDARVVVQIAKTSPGGNFTSKNHPRAPLLHGYRRNRDCGLAAWMLASVRAAGRRQAVPCGYAARRSGIGASSRGGALNRLMSSAIRRWSLSVAPRVSRSSQRWRIRHLRWQNERVRYSWTSSTKYPRQFETLVLSTFGALKMRHAELLGTTLRPPPLTLTWDDAAAG
jgi:hypothetical protein